METLKNFYSSLPKELFNEIILVDDNSPDGTFELAQSLGIQSYKNPKNLGYGGNLKRAITIALNKDADVIVDIHPDGEYRPSAIKPALEKINQGAELVMGNRFYSKNKPTENGMHVWKVMPLLILSWISKKVLNLPINDYHQGFRVYTKSFLEKTNFMANSDNYSFSIELLAQAAYHKIKIAEVPVEVAYTGEKRGASLKNSIFYSFQTIKVLILYILANIGMPSLIFKKQSKQKGNVRYTL